MNVELVDTPQGLTLNSLETQIVVSLAEGTTNKNTALILGLPLTSIASLLRREGVREYVAELREARMMQMRAGISEVAYETLQDKVLQAEENGVRLANTTRKDPVEIAKILSDILKGEQRQIISEEQNPFATIYQQINIIQGRE